MLVLFASVLFVFGYVQREHGYPWLSFYEEFFVVSALLFFSFYVFSRRGLGCVKTPPFVFFFIALTAVVLTQTVSGYLYLSGDGWISALYCSTLVLAYTVGAAGARQNVTGLLNGVGFTLLVSAVISALIAIVQWLDIFAPNPWLVDAFQGTRVGANLGQPNHLSTLLVMGLVCLFYFYETRRLGLLVIVLLSSVMLVALVLAQSRMVWGQLLFLLVWWLLYKKPLALRLPITSLIFALAFFSLGMWCLGDIAEALFFSSEVGSRVVADPVRAALWSELAYAAWHQPFWGYGWNQVQVALTDVMHLFPGTPFAASGHNLILDLILWNGLVIGTIFSVSLAWWGLSRVLRCRTKEVWLALLLIGVVMIHAMLETAHHFLYFLIPVVLLMGSVDALTEEGVIATDVTDGKSRLQTLLKGFSVPRSVMLVVVMFGAVVQCRLWYEYQLIAQDFEVMRFQGVGIYGQAPDPRAADVVLASSIAAAIGVARSSAKENMTNEELEHMRYVVYRYPRPSFLVSYITALVWNERMSEADIMLTKVDNMLGKRSVSNIYGLLKEMAAMDPRIALLLDGHIPDGHGLTH